MRFTPSWVHRPARWICLFTFSPTIATDDEDGIPDPETFSTIYPDLVGEMESRRIPLFVKRCLDIVRQHSGAFNSGPLMILIAVAVKLTSPGPVLFRQMRLGQSGKSFTFLKFRSMYAKADPAIHEAYIKRFISNRTDSPAKAETARYSKCRRTRGSRGWVGFSDEPVLMKFLSFSACWSATCHLSALGHRFRTNLPHYQTWHRRRLLAVKPGNNRLLAGRGTQQSQVRRDGADGYRVCQNVVTLDGHQDPFADAPCRCEREWGLLIYLYKAALKDALQRRCVFFQN